jgi:GT2 family glycosyltransferase
MEYSIVIPVFNREDLTKQCLETLRPTLEGAGEGEVIVVDNGSKPETAAVLAAFPFVRVIRNERNLGFAAACNQGTRAAQGRFVVHLNNDTVGTPGWLATMLRVFDEEPNVGVVGAKLLFPDGTLQHAGVVALPHRFGAETIGPYHYLWQAAGAHPVAAIPVDLEVVTGACLVSPRELFLELGGFEELFWNGYEDVDYCLKVRSPVRNANGA